MEPTAFQLRPTGSLRPITPNYLFHFLIKLIFIICEKRFILILDLQIPRMTSTKKIRKKISSILPAECHCLHPCDLFPTTFSNLFASSNISESTQFLAKLLQNHRVRRHSSRNIVDGVS